MLRIQSRKTLSSRPALRSAAVYSSGCSRARASARPRATARQASQPAAGTNGATTCRPLPPVTEEALQPDGAQGVAHAPRRQDDARPGDPWPGVEVEDDPIGLLQPRDGRAPGVDLEDVHLHQAEQRVDGVDDEVAADLLQLGDADRADG